MQKKNTSSLVHSDVEVKELNTVEERLVKHLRSRVAASGGILDGKSPGLSWTFPLKLCLMALYLAISLSLYLYMKWIYDICIYKYNMYRGVG